MAPVDRQPALRHRRRSSSVADTVAAVDAARRPGVRRVSIVHSPERERRTVPRVAPAPERTFVDMMLERPQLSLAAVIALVFLAGTYWSVLHGTAIPTSALLHVHNHAPERAAYFSRKGNVLNRVFVKRAWGWTAAVYILHLATSRPVAAWTRDDPQQSPAAASDGSNSGAIGVAPHPPPVHSRSRGQRLATFMLGSLAWIFFTAWFFGAGLGDRIIHATGGTCAIPLPQGVDPGALEPILPPGTVPIVHYPTPATLVGAGVGTPVGTGRVPPTDPAAVAAAAAAAAAATATKGADPRIYLPLPEHFCARRLPLTHKTHPGLFELLASKVAKVADKAADKAAGAHAEVHRALHLPPPRWSGGFDISGHAFLLTLGALLLAAEIAPSWLALRARSRQAPAQRDTSIRATLHAAATVAGTVLIGIWLWMLLMTAMYFHDVDEKLAGLALGLVAAAGVHAAIPPQAPPVIEFKTRGRRMSRGKPRKGSVSIAGGANGVGGRESEPTTPAGAPELTSPIEIGEVEELIELPVDDVVNGNGN